jgi:hypothetical protein
MKPLFIAAAIALCSLTTPSRADIQTSPVQFKKGTRSATIEGSIKGGQTIDYTLRAKAGQTMSVTLATKQWRQLFQRAAARQQRRGPLRRLQRRQRMDGRPAGRRRIQGARVSDAQRGTTQRDGQLHADRRHHRHPRGPAEFGKAPASDAKVKGTPFHATGPLPCRMGNDKPIQCEFGVIRGEPGNAEVHITPPGGLKRVLTFMGDKVTTNPGEKVKAVKQGYDWSVEVNDYEHYTIPEAVISGG